MSKKIKVILVLAIVIVFVWFGWYFNEEIQSYVGKYLGEAKYQSSQKKILDEREKMIKELGIYVEEVDGKHVKYYYDEARTVSSENMSSFNFSNLEQCYDLWNKHILFTYLKFDDNSYEEGTVEVKYKEELSRDDIENIIISFNFKKEDIIDLIPEINTFLLHVPKGEEVEWICRLRENPNFIRTGPNAIYHALDL